MLQWLPTVLPTKSRIFLWLMRPLCDFALTHPFNFILSLSSTSCPSQPTYWGFPRPDVPLPAGGLAPAPPLTQYSPGADCSLQGTCGNIWRHIWWSQQEAGAEGTATAIWRPGMLLNFLQCTDSPTTKNPLAPNVRAPSLRSTAVLLSDFFLLCPSQAQPASVAFN